MDADRKNDLETRLDAFDADTRRTALAELAAAWARDDIPARTPCYADHANVHFHTFFSFNVAGWSPSRVAWESALSGLDVAGIVDFDVLDGTAEILAAGDLLRLRTTASIETRVFRADYADREINSPGEPGVNYFMAAGFTRLPDAGGDGARILADLRARAEARTREVARRVNGALPEVAVDYDKDVVPLTPAGNATERHLLAAYDAKARAAFPNRAELVAYWAKRLGLPADDPAWLDDQAKFRTALRAKMMKKGGPGYVVPDASSFPPAGDVVALAKSAGAVPCAAWLDGTSAGEAAVDELLDKYVALGVRAFAIVPDRNWNIADPEQRALKVGKLGEVVAAAKRRGLFFAVGTEMNNYGNRFVDEFTAPELKPFARDFLDGAYTLYGHTVMERFGRMGLASGWAAERFGDDFAKANAFYLEVGRRADPGQELRSRLTPLDAGMAPERALALI